MSGKNCPIIVGAAQFTQHKQTLRPLDPLNLMIKTCRMAIADIGVDDINGFIDSIYMVNINSWSYKDAPGELSKILGIKPKQKLYISDSGNYPQMLVNRAAKAITTDKARAVLITGGESRYSLSQAKKGEIALNWPEKKEPDYMEGKIYYDTVDKFEYKYELWNPAYSYALFETALRAKSGRSIEDHNIYIGKLFEHFSKVASENPYAWIQKSYKAEEIFTPTLENRKVIHPYTKRMCANMFVDQSGALIMTSKKLAEELEIDKKLFVYLMGGVDLQNIDNITQRPSLVDSPALREGSKLTLKQAGLNLNDIDLFDIYSCFPSIVEIARNELGLLENDPRQLTITGGLPYFGGPWSIYSLHAIITAIQLIHKNPLLNIMIIANGGYNTKQSIGIYGTKPPVDSVKEEVIKEIQKSIFEKKLQAAIEKASGQITIEAYTIIYDRDENPEKGIVLGTLENGRRTLANIIAIPEILKQLEKQELVGKKFQVEYDSKLGCNLIKITDYK